MTYTLNSNSNMEIQSSTPTPLESPVAGIVLSSSGITYTPKNSNNTVVYDYIFGVQTSSASSDYGYVQLQENISGTWTDIVNCTRSFGAYELAQEVGVQFFLSGWTGEKQLRLFCSPASATDATTASSNEFWLYGNLYWTDSDDQTPFKCVLTVYEVKA